MRITSSAIDNMIQKNNAFVIPKLKANNALKKTTTRDSETTEETIHHTILSNDIQLSKEAEINRGNNLTITDLPTSSGIKRNSLSCGKNSVIDTKAKKQEYEVAQNKSPKKHRSGSPGLYLLEDENTDEDEVDNNNEIDSNNEIDNNSKIDNYNEIDNDIKIAKNIKIDNDNEIVRYNEDMNNDNDESHMNNNRMQSEAPIFQGDSTNSLHTSDSMSSLGIETIAKIRSLSISESDLLTSHSTGQLSVVYNYNNSDFEFEEDLEYGILFYDSNNSNNVESAEGESRKLFISQINENADKSIKKIEDDNKYKSTEVEKSTLISSDSTSVLGTLLNDSYAETDVKDLVVCNMKKGRKLKTAEKSSTSNRRISIRSKSTSSDLHEMPIEKAYCISSVVKKGEGEASCGASQILEIDIEKDENIFAATTIHCLDRSLSVSKSLKQSEQPFISIVDTDDWIAAMSRDTNNSPSQIDEDDECHSSIGLLYFDNEQVADVSDRYQSANSLNSSPVLSSIFESSNSESGETKINSSYEQDSGILKNALASNDLMNPESESQERLFLNASDKIITSSLKDVDIFDLNDATTAVTSVADLVPIHVTTAAPAPAASTIEGVKKKIRKDKTGSQYTSSNRRSSARFQALSPPSLITIDKNECEKAEIGINPRVAPFIGIPCTFLEGIPVEITIKVNSLFLVSLSSFLLFFSRRYGNVFCCFGGAEESNTANSCE